MGDRPYSRHYHDLIDDAKFAEVYPDDHHYATWSRLLMIADQAWPASAHLPSTARRASVAKLASVGLLDLLPGGRYRIHGLDPERTRRADAARVGGLASGRSRTVERPLNDRSAIVEQWVNLEEKRREETRRVETSTLRDGLPNLTPEAITALEERTGRTVGQAGERQLSEYDELIESHGLEAVCAAMDSLANGKPLSARQLVWGAMKLLEPMIDTRAVVKAEDAEQTERDSWKGIDATQAYLRALRGTA